MTTINTTSTTLFNKFISYFQSKRLRFTINHTLTNHTITLHNLTTPQTNRLLNNFTHHFHLTPSPVLALAA